jgi:Co/Zn/Cd efflux system component
LRLKIKKFEVIIGICVGLLTPVFGMAIVWETYPTLKYVEEFDYTLWLDIVTKIATIGIILNALLFFVFLRFGADRLSKGILYACLIYVVAIVIFKFL